MQPLKRILQWLLLKQDLCWTLVLTEKEVSTTEPKSYQYEPIMIDMILTRSVIGPGATEGADPVIKPASTKFTLPLLTILPINSLAVETVDINFEMEVEIKFLRR